MTADRKAPAVTDSIPSVARPSDSAAALIARPRRVQRQRTKGWKMPEATVYVGRPGRWGNPFSRLPWLDLAESIEVYRLAVQGIWNSHNLRHLSDEKFQATYTAWNTWRIHLGSGHPTEIAWSELSGKNLACWCRLDQPCHADVLLKIANAQGESDV